MIEDSSDENEAVEPDRFLQFDLGDEHYAVDLLTVREVISLPETTKIPRAPAYFLGVMNLRGQVISIIDLRKKLSIKNKEDNSEEAVIIVDVCGIFVGIIVDSINKVLVFKESDLSAMPGASVNINTEYINGIHKKDDVLTVIMNLSKALDISDLEIAKSK